MKWGKLLRQGKGMFLACDQGLEHGPHDFNERNIDPEYVMNIALEGGYTGIIVQAGLAHKYYHGPYTSIPLVVKLNGKTKLQHGRDDPYSVQNCSVDRALKLGASAVGYTLYPGSKYEREMFREFGRIVEQAHNAGIPVIAWVYPRGDVVEDELANDILAYSARIGLELGADMLKMKYNGDLEHMKWLMKCTGRAKLVVSGGAKKDHAELLQELHDLCHEAGIDGIAVGRNVWQDERPFTVSKAIEQVIFHKKSPEEVLHLF